MVIITKVTRSVKYRNIHAQKIARAQLWREELKCLQANQKQLKRCREIVEEEASKCLLLKW